MIWRKKHVLLPVLVGVLFGLASCATLFSGSTGNVSVNSMPTGAQIKILYNGMPFMTGVTPMQARLKKGRDYQVEISLEGYETQMVGIFKGGIEGVAFLNCTNLLFWGIDFATGSIYKLEPGYLNVTLAKVTAENGSETIHVVLSTLDDDGNHIHRSVEMIPEIGLQ